MLVDEAGREVAPAGKVVEEAVASGSSSGTVVRAAVGAMGAVANEGGGATVRTTGAGTGTRRGPGWMMLKMSSFRFGFPMASAASIRTCRESNPQG